MLERFEEAARSPTATRVISLVGVLFVVYGIVGAVWTQLVVDDYSPPVFIRVNQASTSLTLVALGVLVFIAAQLLAAILRRDSN